MAAKKLTTNIAGLEVVPNAREVLLNSYKTLLALVGKLPTTSGYRLQVEKTTQQRLDILQKQESFEVVEKEINCGQIEELIEQANDEIRLASKFSEWKPWEPLSIAPLPNQWKFP
eukprot:Sdes_comp18289_c0_seq5m7969